MLEIIHSTVAFLSTLNIDDDHYHDKYDHDDHDSKIGIYINNDDNNDNDGDEDNDDDENNDNDGNEWLIQTW